MDRLIEIADELAELRVTKAQTSLLQWQANQDLAAREIELTPADGWPGKNQEQRDTAKAKALTEDSRYQERLKVANTAYKALAELDARIQGLEDERRALEWGIRLRQVAALESRPQGDHHSQDGQLFDEQLQHEIEERVWDDGGKPVDYSEFHQTAPAATYKMLAPEPDEIPF